MPSTPESPIPTKSASSTTSSRPMSKPPTSNMRLKRDHGELDTEIVDLTSEDDPSRPSRKRGRVGPSPIPRTLPMEPHAELLAELKGKYVILTATVISSSKINKKVSAVLSHLGHVDMFSQEAVPGVMMLHARAHDASKLCSIMDLAKTRMGEIGQAWYQYNRVYEVAEERNEKKKNTLNGGGEAKGTQMIIKDTVLEGDKENDAVEPTKTLEDLTLQEESATESKTTYMSIFLSRVPMRELEAKPSFTLQTNAGQVGSRR